MGQVVQCHPAKRSIYTYKHLKSDSIYVYRRLSRLSINDENFALGVVDKKEPKSLQQEDEKPIQQLLEKAHAA
jgi:hypothetical protein